MPDKAATIATITTNATYVGGCSTVVIGTWSLNEIPALFGMTITALTFGLNWFYRHRMYKLAKNKMTKRKECDD